MNNNNKFQNNNSNSSNVGNNSGNMKLNEILSRNYQEFYHKHLSNYLMALKPEDREKLFASVKINVHEVDGVCVMSKRKQELQLTNGNDVSSSNSSNVVDMNASNTAQNTNTNAQNTNTNTVGANVNVTNGVNTNRNSNKEVLNLNLNDFQVVPYLPKFRVAEFQKDVILPTFHKGKFSKANQYRL